MNKLLFLTFLCSCSTILFCENKALNGARLTKQDIACIGKIFSLISRRLEIASEIAKWKWNHRIPIDIRDKKKNLLAQLVEEVGNQIDIQFGKSIIISQLNAEKTLQIQLFENWITEEVYLVPLPSCDLPSLEKTIFEIDKKIIDQLIYVYIISSRPDFLSQITYAAIENLPEEKVPEELRNEIIKSFIHPNRN